MDKCEKRMRREINNRRKGRRSFPAWEGVMLLRRAGSTF
jgi:hypothetical protein